MKTQRELKDELESFQSLWKGGFYGGDPADPTFGLYGLNAFMGVSHAIYLSCLKPYIRSDVTALEFGCGRGSWTRHMLDAKTVYCLDALPAEHNGFYEYVGRHDHVHYFQVHDFSMSMIPENSLDYAFSYDVLCHVSPEGIAEYARNMLPRMRSGAEAFWMVADYETYNSFIDNLESTNVLNCMLTGSKRPILSGGLRFILRQICRWNRRRYSLRKRTLNEDDIPRPGRWYNAGRDRTVNMLRQVGYHIIADDVCLDFRSPIIHFRKP